MKLPYVTIEYREEETYALGKVSVALIVGFALYWAWTYSFLFNGHTLFFPHALDVSAMLFPTTIASLALALLSYGCFFAQMRQLFSTRQKRNRNRRFAALCVFTGMVLVVGANFIPSAQFVLGFCAGILSGVGSAILVMSYGVSFSVCDLPTIAFCTAVSLPAGAIAFAAIMLIDSVAHPLGSALCMTLPFLQLLCLRTCSANLVDKLEFRAITIPVRTVPFALHICLPSLVFGVILGLVCSYTVHMPEDFENLKNVAFAIAIAGLFSFATIVFAMLTQRKANNFAFRTLVPIAAILLAILIVPAINERPFATFSLFGTYLVLEASMWIMYSDISQRFRISAFTVFGFGRAALSLGTLIGYLCSLPSGPLSDAQPGTAPFLAVALVTLTFGVALLPNNRELRRALKLGRSCPALLSENDYVFDSLDATSMPSGERANGLAALANFRAEAPAGNTCAGDASPKTQGAKPSEESDRTVEQRTDEDLRKNAGWFKRKCQVIADRYLLSRREAEVLFLLAKGRSSATIQENLFISEGTANTHMRHIYRKLDVHSQRELMDLVEMVDLDD